MPLSRRLAYALVALSLGGATRTAWAVCTVTTCTATAITSNPQCCTGGPGGQCVLDGTVTLSGPTCTLDFGGRAVTLSGTLLVEGRTLTLRAASFRIDPTGCQASACGLLNARGASPNRGGNVLILSTGSVSVQGPAASGVDLSGFGLGAGTLTVQAGGAVALVGGSVVANGLDANGNGGAILIDAGGEVTVGTPIRADAGVGGFGGTVLVRTAAALTVTDGGRVTVRGGISEGGIEFDAAGRVLLTSASQLQANGIASGASFGGTVDIIGRSVEMHGTIEAQGGTDTTGDAGGDGGIITVEATDGSLIISGGPGIVVSGAGGGSGGEVNLITDSAALGDLVVDTTITAEGKGGILNRPAGGGLVEVDSARGITLTRIIDVTGVGGGGGEVDLTAQRNATISSSIQASDPDGGGALSVTAFDITMNNGGQAKMNGLVESRFPLSPGGDVVLAAGNDILIDGYVIDASGAASGPGGDIFMDAGRNLTVASRGGTMLDVSSGGTAGAHGGSIRLAAGDGGLTGQATIAGTLKATGRSGPTATPGAVRVDGCQVTISGSIDSRGDAGSANVLTGRTGITVERSGSVRATGGNTFVFRTGSPPAVTGGTVLPAAFPVPRSLCVTAGTPADCLMPCPTCGNGSLEFPETCDPGQGSRCAANCDLHCRSLLPPGCNDGNVCSDDGCDETFGCTSVPSPPRPCDDGNACTLDETCRGGFCLGTGALDCDDHDLCTADACDRGTGCTHMALACGCTSNAQCSDHDLCNGTETCGTDGRCRSHPENAPICDDNNGCTVDTCDPVLGCRRTPIPNCVPCVTSLDCNDPCATCAADKRCVFHPGCCTRADQCDDLQACTDDVCQGGLCAHTQVADGTAPAGCRELCGTCSGGTCQPECTDPDPEDCEFPVCDAGGTCTLRTDPRCCTSGAAACNDDDVCTIDTCKVEVHRCEHAPLKPNCTLCTSDTDCDAEGRCAGEACGDDGTCTDVAAPNCNDRRPDFGGRCVLDAALAPACVYSCITAAACDDGDLCTDDRCDAVFGCVHDPKTSDVERVRCQLAIMEGALGAAAETDIKAALRTKLGKLIAGARVKLAAVETPGPGRKRVKAARAADAKVQAIRKAVTAARRGRKPKISAALADALLRAADGASAAIENLIEKLTTG